MQERYAYDRLPTCTTVDDMFVRFYGGYEAFSVLEDVQDWSVLAILASKGTEAYMAGCTLRSDLRHPVAGQIFREGHDKDLPVP